MKVIKDNHNGNTNGHKLLENEVKLLQKASHPYIVKLASKDLVKNIYFSTSSPSPAFSGILLEGCQNDFLQLISSVYPNTVEVSYIKHIFVRVLSAL